MREGGDNERGRDVLFIENALFSLQTFPYKRLDLLVAFPGDYPTRPLSVSLPNDQGIPPTFLSHANDAIAEHLETEGLTDREGGLMFRPFLRWLDRTITEIFQEAARKVRWHTLTP